LEARFTPSKLMDALEILYPKYWQDFEVDGNFKQHFLVIKGHFVHMHGF
jgi:hypothetical protein